MFFLAFFFISFVYYIRLKCQIEDCTVLLQKHDESRSGLEMGQRSHKNCLKLYEKTIITNKFGIY